MEAVFRLEIRGPYVHETIFHGVELTGQVFQRNKKFSDEFALEGGLKKNVLMCGIRQDIVQPAWGRADFTALLTHKQIAWIQSSPITTFSVSSTFYFSQVYFLAEVWKVAELEHVSVSTFRHRQNRRVSILSEVCLYSVICTIIEGVSVRQITMLTANHGFHNRVLSSSSVWWRKYFCF